MNINNRGKNAGSNVAKNTNHNNNENNRNNSYSGSGGKAQKNAGNATHRNRVQKINNLQAAASADRDAGNRSGHQGLDYLMGVKDPSIRRWLFKSCSTSSTSCNETRMQHIVDKQQTKPATPARKRSSLARPVRVHDSFPQEHGPTVIEDWNETQNLQNQEIQLMHQLGQRQPQQKNDEPVSQDFISIGPSDKNRGPFTETLISRKLKVVEGPMENENEEGSESYMVKSRFKGKDERNKKKRENLEHAIDDLVEIRVDEEVTTWPIRLGLGELLQLSLPKCRGRKRRRRHCMVIATMREKTIKSMMEAGGIRASRQQGAFKDTERLLKVLSINNVDQVNRYNVARCSVM